MFTLLSSLLGIHFERVQEADFSLVHIAKRLWSWTIEVLTSAVASLACICNASRGAHRPLGVSICNGLALSGQGRHGLLASTVRSWSRALDLSSLSPQIADLDYGGGGPFLAVEGMPLCPVGEPESVLVLLSIDARRYLLCPWSLSRGQFWYCSVINPIISRSMILTNTVYVTLKNVGLDKTSTIELI